MKSPRTLEELDTALDKDLSWRRLEIEAITSLIKRNPTGSKMKDCLLRSRVALLYAHWEGFIRQASKQYAAYVAAKHLQFAELSPSFLTLSIRSLLSEVAGANKSVIHRKLVEFFSEDMDRTCNIPFDDLISAKSNLTSEVFFDICESLGIDHNSFLTKSKLIDERLVRNRNFIAHGDYLEIDEELFKALKGQMLEIMNEYKNRISNAAVLESFRKRGSLPGITNTSSSFNSGTVQQAGQSIS